jgi:NADH dehydrogenase [ubiquinone] 1 alpha subcomplex assembly factor 5
MEEYRHKQAVGSVANQGRHVTRHGPRDRDLTPIFEAYGERSRDVAVSHCRARSCDPRHSRQARAASPLVSRLQRHSARRAAAVAEELHLFPAIWAEGVDIGDDRPAAGAAWRKREIECPAREPAEDCNDHRVLSLMRRQRTSSCVPELFDMALRALRRDRAARIGPELFLHERAFADCLDRIALLQHQFGHALLVGCPDPTWPERLREFVGSVAVIDPGPLFAAASGGQPIVEDVWQPPTESYDLVLAVGILDSVNDLPLAFRLIREGMRGDALFIGAMSGGDTLPQLRSAMRAADALAGAAAPHIHPRIEASALAPLLDAAGFTDTVVDVDRVSVSYPSLERLVSDLRAMGASNILLDRPRFVGRAARDAAARALAQAGDGSRTVETFEILHFAAHTPPKH